MEAPKVFIGTSDSCDFEQNTWTFRFDGQFQVSAGEYVILKRADYQKLLSVARADDASRAALDVLAEIKEENKMIPLNTTKIIPIHADFTTTIGYDIPVAVQVEYDPGDAGVGLFAGYLIKRIWIESDLNATDLYSLLTYEVECRIRKEVMKHFADNRRDK